MKRLFWIIVLVNLFSALLGFTLFYGVQFSETDPALWLFVPDCPLAALLVGVALLALRFGKRWDCLVFLSSVSALKYGFWTVFVLSLYSGYYWPVDGWFIYSLLFIGHAGLFSEGLLLLPGTVRVKAWHLLLTLAFLGLNDYSDYFWGTHPLFQGADLEFMKWATMASTVFFTLAAFALFKKKKKPFIQL